MDFCCLLIVPQLIHYGTLRQADEARLYLHPDFYGVGDSLASLVTLVLLPRNDITVAAGAFITVLKTYRVSYVLTLPDKDSALVALCHGQQVLVSAEGMVLWHFQPPCNI